LAIVTLGGITPTSGKPGDVFRVTGTGIIASPLPLVQFAGVNATILNATTTQVFGLVPTQPALPTSNVTLKVTNSDATSASIVSAFKYTSNAACTPVTP